MLVYVSINTLLLFLYRSRNTLFHSLQRFIFETIKWHKKCWKEAPFNEMPKIQIQKERTNKKKPKAGYGFIWLVWKPDCYHERTAASITLLWTQLFFTKFLEVIGKSHDLSLKWRIIIVPVEMRGSMWKLLGRTAVQLRSLVSGVKQTLIQTPVWRFSWETVKSSFSILRLSFYAADNCASSAGWLCEWKEMRQLGSETPGPHNWHACAQW